MPEISRRNLLKSAAVPAAITVSGCVSAVRPSPDDGSENRRTKTDCPNTTVEKPARGGQIQARPADGENDEYPIIDYSENFPDPLKTVVGAAANSNKKQTYYDLSADELYSVEKHLIETFCITSDRLYIVHNGDTLQVTMISNSLATTTAG